MCGHDFCRHKAHHLCQIDWEVMKCYEEAWSVVGWLSVGRRSVGCRSVVHRTSSDAGVGPSSVGCRLVGCRLVGCRSVVHRTSSDAGGVDDFAFEEGVYKDGGGMDHFFIQQSTKICLHVW
jgi:hypothetical protein